MRLDDYRAEIDTIDKQIMKLLEQRLQTVKNIGLCKHAMGKPVLDASRENSKLEAGDHFVTGCFIKEQPLYLPYIERNGERTASFVAGRNGGLTLISIISQ